MYCRYCGNVIDDNACSKSSERQNEEKEKMSMRRRLEYTFFFYAVNEGGDIKIHTL